MRALMVHIGPLGSLNEFAYIIAATVNLAAHTVQVDSVFKYEVGAEHIELAF